MRVRLPSYLEGSAPLRRTWASGMWPRCGDHRPAARLLCRRNLPGLNSLLSWHRTRSRRRHNLWPAGGCGPALMRLVAGPAQGELVGTAALRCGKERRWRHERQGLTMI